jgi:hypothetical protein
MGASERTSGPAIGAALRDARQRLGLDIAVVEERTKIRARYIRALENEDWDTLPGPAYIRGFLRTYGQMLGLDGETLADEYRRRYEEPPAASSPAAEPLLSERRRLGERPPSRGRLIAAVVAGLVLVLVLIGLLSGGEDEEPVSERGDRQERKIKQQAGKQKEREPTARSETEIALQALSTVELCVVADGDSALVDDQVLSEGSEERFSGAKRYRVDVTGGTIDLRVGEARQEIESNETVSFEGDSNGIREIEPQSDCP